MTNGGSPSTLRRISLIGGFGQKGDWQVPDNLVAISGIGGVNLDLTEATLPHVLTITKISLVGGVSLRVPADVRVEVEGFTLIGGIGRLPAAQPSDEPRTVRVRAYGIVGGVSIKRG
jgi:predicted membrane protein